MFCKVDDFPEIMSSLTAIPILNELENADFNVSSFALAM
jgi:hypothetical protein